MTPNITINSNNHLSIAGIDCAELVATYGTPLFVMDEARVRENCRTYINAVAQHFPAGSKVLYASKALCFRGIYDIIHSEGLGADVVSSGEIHTATSRGELCSPDHPVGFAATPPQRGIGQLELYFHGHNKTAADVEYALDKQVTCFVVDAASEIDLIAAAAAARGTIANVQLRLSPGIDPSTHAKIQTGGEKAKFGASIASGHAEKLLAKALATPQVNVIGYHCHIGSQIFDIQPYLDTVDIMVEFSAAMKQQHGYEPQYLNFGGGFAVRYVEKQPQVDIPAMIAAMGARLVETCAIHGLKPPAVMLEPGRSIIADAVTTLYTVGTIKEIPGICHYTNIDGGMTDNPRYALYQSAYTIINASRAGDEPTLLTTIAGRCCESGDLIQENVRIAPPQSGDILAVLGTGAYNYSMASNYNRLPRPALVIVNDGEARLGIRRETLEDVARLDV